jgi:arylsulfatase A-like enzyme
MNRQNILFVTLDQFRADSMGCAGHPLVRTPNLDRLSHEGVRFARHYSQAAPCAPGRAALYTGTYQMNNRVLANGTPLDDRFDNIARAAARSGYIPTLFGYTDQAVDPRTVTDPDDVRLHTYEGVLPGFVTGLDLTGNQQPWVDWLRAAGFEIASGIEALNSEDRRGAEFSESAFLTDRLLDWLGSQTEPWFVHASYLRPHPPYRAAGHYASMYDPADSPEPLPVPSGTKHQLYEGLLNHRETAASARRRTVAEIRAQYYGMISEVDDNLGRIWTFLEQTNQWENTIIVVTSDHGEQLGDQGLLGKAGFFESSYHVLGLIRDPRSPAAHGNVVEHFTENVDVFPTLCEAMGIEVPRQCDGFPLTPFLQGQLPTHWRDAATYEWDWSDSVADAESKISAPSATSVRKRSREGHHLTVRRSDTHAYVQFDDGTYLCFDLRTDSPWVNEESNLRTILDHAQAMLVWRARQAERTLTHIRIGNG